MTSGVQVPGPGSYSWSRRQGKGHGERRSLQILTVDCQPDGDSQVVLRQNSRQRRCPPPNQTEMDILAEELLNQERRKEKKAGEYRAAEKDW